MVLRFEVVDWDGIDVVEGRAGCGGKSCVERVCSENLIKTRGLQGSLGRDIYRAAGKAIWWGKLSREEEPKSELSLSCGGFAGNFSDVACVDAASEGCVNVRVEYFNYVWCCVSLPPSGLLDSVGASEEVIACADLLGGDACIFLTCLDHIFDQSLDLEKRERTSSRDLERVEGEEVCYGDVVLLNGMDEVAVGSDVEIRKSVNDVAHGNGCWSGEVFGTCHLLDFWKISDVCSTPARV